MNKNCLSYWFPILEKAGVQVPKTVVIKTECDFDALLYGSVAHEERDERLWDELLDKIHHAALAVGGYPVFLRTGQGSGKHQWKETCFLTCRNSIGSHVSALVEWSGVVDIMGLDQDVWVVRELLPTRPLCTLPAYKDFPLVPEVRCFVKGGNVVCAHPYWPEDSIFDGFPYAKSGRSLIFDDDDEPVRDLPANFQGIVAAAHNLNPAEYMPLAEKVAVAFKDDGAWSVDLLPTESGWYVTDMAVAARSFHWEGCPNKGKL